MICLVTAFWSYRYPTKGKKLLTWPLWTLWWVYGLSHSYWITIKTILKIVFILSGYLMKLTHQSIRTLLIQSYVRAAMLISMLQTLLEEPVHDITGATPICNNKGGQKRAMWCPAHFLVVSSIQCWRAMGSNTNAAQLGLGKSWPVASL